MKSPPYDVSLSPKNLKLVFNFLLSILVPAAESSPNTSPTKPGTEQDERIKNFDQEVFVKVFEDLGTDVEEEDDMEEDDDMEEGDVMEE
jgi:hypothetical protein